MNAMEKRLKDAASMGPEYAESVRRYLAANGAKGGSAKSDRKTRAARKNAKKGGWPKGRPRKPNAERKKVVAVGAKRSCPKRKKYNAEAHAP